MRKIYCPDCYKKNKKRILITKDYILDYGAGKIKVYCPICEYEELLDKGIVDNQ